MSEIEHEAPAWRGSIRFVVSQTSCYDLSRHPSKIEGTTMLLGFRELQKPRFSWRPRSMCFALHLQYLFFSYQYRSSFVRDMSTLSRYHLRSPYCAARWVSCWRKTSDQSTGRVAGTESRQALLGRAPETDIIFWDLSVVGVRSVLWIWFRGPRPFYFLLVGCVRHIQKLSSPVF